MDLHLHLKQAQKEMGLTHEQKEAKEIYGYDIYGEVTQLA